MTEPPRRALPPPLVLGLVLTASYLMFWFGAEGGAKMPSVGTSAITGLGSVGHALVAYGLLVLSDRHASAVRRALRVTAAAWFVMLGFELFDELMVAFSVPGALMAPLAYVMRYGDLAMMVTAAVGLAVAVWHRSPTLSATVMAIWIGSVMTTVFIAPLVSATGYRAIVLLDLVLYAIRLAVLLGVVIALAGTPQAVDVARVGGDLRRTAQVLRVAVGGMIAATAALVLLTSLGAGHPFAGSVVGTLAVALGAAVFAWLGLALVGAARDREVSISPYALAVAGTIALWCGRMLFAALPEMCSRFAPAPAPRVAGDVMGTALFVVPVAAVVGAAVLAWTISAFARRSGLAELRGQASLHAYSVIAALFVGPLILVKLADHSASAAVLFLVVVCVVQAVLLARLCLAAAVAVDRRSELPAARVVRA